MKIKCLQFECEECGKVSTIQLFFRSNGELSYGRARHYIGRQNGKAQFEYHQQSIEYINSKLIELPTDKSEIGHNGHIDNVDLVNAELSSKVSNMAGPKGFEPLTFSLEG